MVPWYVGKQDYKTEIIANADDVADADGVAILNFAQAQVVVDKTVATVNNGSLTTPDVITYSDLVWQMALQRDTPIDKPSSKELTNRGS